MIYDLEKIDFSRLDKLKKTIYMSIYDTKTDDMDAEEHKLCMKRKVELYVNYILSKGMAEYFSIKEEKEKKYKYVINIVRDFEVGQEYINYVNDIDDQVNEYTGGRVRVTT